MASSRKLVVAAPLDHLYARNVFLALGKFVHRQEENLLTQALVLLFNRVEPFRRALCEQLQERSPSRKLDPDKLTAYSQVNHWLRGRRIVVDMEIRSEDEKHPPFLIESKLGSGLGRKQLRNYKAALRNLPSGSRFVLITKYGIDDRLWKYSPRKTVWLSWPLVVGLAAECSRRAPRLDQLLIQDFLEMTRHKGIAIVPKMTTDSFRRLSMLSAFAYNRYQRLNQKTIVAADTALQRLKEHRDSAWENLVGRSGRWSPYQDIIKWDEERCVVLRAGFYELKPQRNVQERYIGLELTCGTKPRLYLIQGWKLSPRHPRYKREDPDQVQEWYFSPKETWGVFRKPMPAAIKDVEGTLRKYGIAFLRSRHAGSR